MITNMPLLFQCLNHLGYDYLPKLTGNGDERDLIRWRREHRLDPYAGLEPIKRMRVALNSIENAPDYSTIRIPT